MSEEQPEIEDWMRVLTRLPFVGSFKRDLVHLRKLLYDRRAPRVAALGPAASGRTSLANGLLSAMALGQDGVAPPPPPGRWIRLNADGRRLDWLELPSDAERERLLETARRAFDETPADVLLVTIPAAPEGLAEAAESVGEAVAALTDRQGGAPAAPKVVVALTQADRLAGRDATPYSGATLEVIDQAVATLRKALTDLDVPKERFIAVAAGPTVGDDALPRFRVEELGELLVAELPDAAKVEAVRAFGASRDARQKVARSLVNTCAALAVTVGLAPVPFADAMILLPMQAAMVTGIAYMSGRPWDRRAAVEWLAGMGLTGGVGVGLRWGAQQLVKVIPGAGSLIGAGVAGTGTLAIGRSAIGYFIYGPGASLGRPMLRADHER